MEIYPVNLTIFAMIGREVCLQNIYELLVCVSIPDYIFVEKKTIEFFGINGIFIGAKSDTWGSRGIRCQTETGEYSGAMKNCVSVDYQYNSKNINIKISKNLFHINGLTSIEIGESIANSMMDNLLEVARIWQPFFDLSIQDRIAFFDEVVIPMVSGDECLLSPSDPKLLEKFNEIKDELGDFSDVARLSISFLEHYKTADEYFGKLRKIAMLTQHGDDIFSMNGKFEITSVTNSDGIYIGKIPHSKLLIGSIVMHLLSLGFDASHFNEKGKAFRVSTTTGLEEYEMRKTNSKLPRHQITVNDTGKVRVNSPGIPEFVLEEARYILKIICDFIESPIYPRVNMRDVGSKIKLLSQKREHIGDDIKLSPSSISEILDDGDFL